MNVAVIGVGNIGKQHARNYHEIEGVNLVSIADIDEVKAKETSKIYSCNYYLNYQEMFEKETIDALSIAVPTKYHFNIAKDVINKNINLLVEKPIAGSIEEAESMIKLAEEKNVKLFIGHVERFNPAVKRIKDIIEKGQLGDIISISSKRVGLFPPQISNANVIIDLAVHDIDIINYLINKKPINVYSNGGRALLSKREDYAEILLSYGNISGFIQVNWLTPIKIRKLFVTGTKGYAELDYITQKLVIYESNYDKTFTDFGDFIYKFGKPNKITIDLNVEEPLKNELKSFVNCVKQDKIPTVTGQQGLSALKIALKAIEFMGDKN